MVLVALGLFGEKKIMKKISNKEELQKIIEEFNKDIPVGLKITKNTWANHNNQNIFTTHNLYSFFDSINEFAYWVTYSKEGDFIDRILCENCKQNICNFYKYSKGYKKCCCNKCRNNRKSKASIKIWHNRTSKELEEIIKKKEKTNLKNYGVTCYFQTKEFKRKSAETNLKKYGVENGGWTVKSIDKIKRHNQDKYGVDFFITTKEFKNKSTATHMQKYGVSNFFKRNDLIKKSIKDKYNVENISQLDCIKKKKYKTIIKNGTINISNKEKQWLKNLYVPECQKFISTTKKGYIVDGYNKQTNIIYEFLGDYWHQRPGFKDYTEQSPKFIKTLERFKALKESGYSIIYCWENDFKQDKCFQRTFYR